MNTMDHTMLSHDAVKIIMTRSLYERIRNLITSNESRNTYLAIRVCKTELTDNRTLGENLTLDGLEFMIITDLSQKLVGHVNSVLDIRRS